jgi:predicted transglutaminase-like cysteine proteinase
MNLGSTLQERAMTRNVTVVLFVCFGLLLITAPASSAVADLNRLGSLDTGDYLIGNRDDAANQANYDRIEKVGDKLYRFQTKDGKVTATPVGEVSKPAAAPSPVAVAKPDSDSTLMPSEMPAELKSRMDELKNVGKNINDELKKMDNADHLTNVQASNCS